MSTQTETQANRIPTTTDWHWVMTVQTSDGRLNTRSAVITVPDGFTRAQAFDYVFKQFKEDFGIPLTVLCFDLQPNQL
ncbi:hypothetical protein ABT282_15950 [Streptomyces sp. NPDC000927]|uniref:hypothetical protein n=1 Tax=Streptomyces sp. NPDC000927 TaxID=3154371 RepID=UPI0033191591